MFSFLKGLVVLLFWLAIPVGAVLIVLKIFFVDIVVVGHNGMAPTLIHGERVALWRNAAIEHGDVVLCRHPQQPTRFVIGRVIATDGMALTTFRGQLRINGNVLARDAQGQVDFFDSTSGYTLRMNWGIERLGNNEHYYFQQVGRPMGLPSVPRVRGIYLLSDNATYSREDSRSFGPVSPGTCLGQIVLRLGRASRVPVEIPHGMFDLIE